MQINSIGASYTANRSQVSFGELSSVASEVVNAAARKVAQTSQCFQDAVEARVLLDNHRKMGVDWREPANGDFGAFSVTRDDGNVPCVANAIICPVKEGTPQGILDAFTRAVEGTVSARHFEKALARCVDSFDKNPPTEKLIAEYLKLKEQIVSFTNEILNR